MTSPASASTYRFELTLRKPWLGWFPKPTVVLDGRGQPAQWGSRSWQVTDDGSATVRVFLFNRIWKYGAAEFRLDGRQGVALEYSAPWLPFLAGKIRAIA